MEAVSLMAKVLTTTKDSCKRQNLINVAITDFMLTPLSCSHIINEIIKCLMYQKAQIPYPYNWLKTVVNKKRSREVEDDSRTQNFKASNHYRQASVAYDTLNELMGGITREFTKCSAPIEQVVVVFGTVPHCPQQIYNINIPNLTKNHSDKNHMNELLKHQHKIFREVFLSDAWMDSMDIKLSTVNTYVFLKKRQPQSMEVDNFFVPCRTQQFEFTSKQMIINIEYENEKYTNTNCCNFEVFSETNLPSRTKQEDSNPEKDLVVGDFWYSAKSPVTGFKDCFINKVSASELW